MLVVLTPVAVVTAITVLASLLIVLRGTAPADRPEILRALADVLRGHKKGP